MDLDGWDVGRRDFSGRRRVRFGDCDPAALVFYPRYLEMLNGLVEDWWTFIGLPWRDIMPRLGIATPVSHLETWFAHPSAMGDELILALQVEAVGRSSLRLRLRVDGADGGLRLLARQRMVCLAAPGGAPRPWPDDVGAVLRAWLG